MIMKSLKLGLIFFLLFVSQNCYTQDWANLERFKKDNEMVLKSDSTQQRIVFMGNSITEGWLNFRPEFFEGKPYINRGIGGQTTPQMLLRFRQDVIDLKPSVVVILAGINDIAGNTGPSTIEMIMDNLKSMSELAIANDIKVVFCSVLPAKDFPWRSGLEPANKVIKLNTLLQSYVKRHNLVYVDYFSAMVDDSNGLKQELGYDGVHPNALGYSIMEPLVEKGIKIALAN
jgi:lysophospholipase L1-like esterase